MADAGIQVAYCATQNELLGFGMCFMVLFAFGMLMAFVVGRE